MPDTFDKLTGTARQPDADSVPISKSLVEGDAFTGTASPEGSAAIHHTTNVADSEDMGVDTRTPQQIREAAQELTRYGLVEAVRKPNLYRVLQNQQQTIAKILEPLDLDLKIDDVRGIAFVTVHPKEPALDLAEQHDPDDWSHPLVRRQRLTLEQSLLIAILRQHFVAHEQEAGVGADDARVAVDELIPEFQVYMGDPGSEAKERNRMLTLLDQLKGHGLVSEPDSHERVTIRPIIAHLASPENLLHLLTWLRQRRSGTDKSEVVVNTTQPNNGDATNL